MCVIASVFIGINGQCTESRVTLERVFQIFETTQAAVDRGDSIIIGKHSCRELHMWSRDHFDNTDMVYSKAQKRYSGERLNDFYAFYENIDGCIYE